MADSATARLEELKSVSATEAKNGFGAVLDRVLAGEKVAITKYDQIRAVVLSAGDYEALLDNQRDPLATLRSEFDGLLASLQTPRARSAGRALFEASPARLGRVAVANARRRG